MYLWASYRWPRGTSTGRDAAAVDEQNDQFAGGNGPARCRLDPEDLAL
jgi:hypothetical protein